MDRAAGWSETTSIEAKGPGFNGGGTLGGSIPPKSHPAGVPADQVGTFRNRHLDNIGWRTPLSGVVLNRSLAGFSIRVLLFDPGIGLG